MKRREAKLTQTNKRQCGHAAENAGKERGARNAKHKE